mgnify:FL=1|tara:strand:+ start:2616 stop:3200 length:585 start_codon:yes stop_codon:yes gene_type:complete
MHKPLNIDNKALIIDNFLPEEFFIKLLKKEFLNITINKTWDKALFEKDNKPLLQRVKSELELYNYFHLSTQKKETVKDPLFKKLFEYVLNCSHFPLRKDNIEFSMEYYEYNKNAGINWHTDGDYSLNFSLYIHKKWDKDWGGETLIDTERGLPLASIPYSNRIVCIKNNVWHKVCPINVDVPRRVIQMRARFLT